MRQKSLILVRMRAPPEQPIAFARDSVAGPPRLAELEFDFLRILLKLQQKIPPTIEGNDSLFSALFFLSKNLLESLQVRREFYTCMMFCLILVWCGPLLASPFLCFVRSLYSLVALSDLFCRNNGLICMSESA